MPGPAVDAMVAPPESTMAPVVIRQAIKGRKEHESGAARVKALLFLLLMFVIGLLVALIMAAQNQNAAPTCNGVTMSPGDTCLVIGDDGGDFSYQQMQQRRNNSHDFWMIAGWCAVGLSVVLVVPVARVFSPKRPWGTAINSPCPSCGRNTLRERMVNYRVRQGKKTWRFPNFVTLCGEGCAYAWSGRESLAANQRQMMSPAAYGPNPVPPVPGAPVAPPVQQPNYPVQAPYGQNPGPYAPGPGQNPPNLPYRPPNQPR